MENCRKVKFEIYFLTAFEMKTVNKISQQFMLKYISCLSFNIPIMVISLKDREGVDREFFLLRVMNIIFLLFVPIFLSTQILSNLSFIASKEQEKYLYFCKLLQQLKTTKPNHFAKAQGEGKRALIIIGYHTSSIMPLSLWISIALRPAVLSFRAQALGF